MVINLFGASVATEAAGQAGKASTGVSASSSGKASGSGLSTEDTTSLSSGSSVEGLTQQALQVVPSRADKVQALKQAVTQGQYQLDAEKIALALSSADL